MMKQQNTVSAMLLYKVVIISLVLMAYGCNKDEDANKTETPVSTSKLADTSLPTDTSFANFENKNISIDPSALPLGGNRIFLKLSRLTGEILFLGEIERYRVFNLKVNLLLDETLLNYVIFSDDSNDTTQTGVITL